MRHALPALEDAFRTASLPGAGARLVCVRRLELGRLPSNGSPQSVALLIEKRFAEGRSGAVHASESGADIAEAVWFRDALEAHEAAALRIAAGKALDAWFWRLAIPNVMTATDAEKLRTIAFAIAATEEAPRALPAWTASLVRAGYREQLISALRPGDGHVLLRAAAVSSLASEFSTAATAIADETRNRGTQNRAVDDRAAFVELTAKRAAALLPQPFTPMAERAAARDAQSADGIAPAPDTPTRAPRGRAARPQLVASQERIAGEGFEPAGDRLIRAATKSPARDESTEAVVPDTSRHRRGERRAAGSPDAPSEQPDAVVAESTRAEGPGETDPAAGAPLAFRSPWQLPYAPPTTAGGLLFLLPVLERVGLTDWVTERALEEPAPDVMAAQILHLLLSRLRVEADDPAWGIATPEGSEAAFWLTGCRRYLRRRVHVGLASLVVRRARIAITPTHVDVFFRLNAADVRVRRAGLDVDPGWVPWFGRVVTFHYEDRPWN